MREVSIRNTVQINCDLHLCVKTRSRQSAARISDALRTHSPLPTADYAARDLHTSTLYDAGHG